MSLTVCSLYVHQIGDRFEIDTTVAEDGDNGQNGKVAQIAKPRQVEHPPRLMVVDVLHERRIVRSAKVHLHSRSVLVIQGQVIDRSLKVAYSTDFQCAAKRSAQHRLANLKALAYVTEVASLATATTTATDRLVPIVCNFIWLLSFLSSLSLSPFPSSKQC